VCGEGLLFGNDDPVSVQTAVSYEIEKHNNSSSTLFLLDPYEKSVDAADSFDVCKACELSALCHAFHLVAQRGRLDLYPRRH